MRTLTTAVNNKKEPTSTKNKQFSSKSIQLPASLTCNLMVSMVSMVSMVLMAIELMALIHGQHKAATVAENEKMLIMLMKWEALDWRTRSINSTRITMCLLESWWCYTKITLANISHYCCYLLLLLPLSQLALLFISMLRWPYPHRQRDFSLY